MEGICHTHFEARIDSLCVCHPGWVFWLSLQAEAGPAPGSLRHKEKGKQWGIDLLPRSFASYLYSFDSFLEMKGDSLLEMFLRGVAGVYNVM